MGNAASVRNGKKRKKQNNQIMAIEAMAEVMELKLGQVVTLRNQCHAIYNERKKKQQLSKMRSYTDDEEDGVIYNCISRREFQKAMKKAGILPRRSDDDGNSNQVVYDFDGENSYDIIDHLFSMWDETGDESIQYLCFVVGLSPLASCKNSKTISSVLDFSLQVIDIEDTGRFTANRIFMTLSSINAISSYFGDVVLCQDEIEQIVEEIFEDVDGNSFHDLPHRICVKRLKSHPLVRKFSSSNGKYQYRPDHEYPEKSKLVPVGYKEENNEKNNRKRLSASHRSSDSRSISNLETIAEDEVEDFHDDSTTVTIENNSKGLTADGYGGFLSSPMKCYVGDNRDEVEEDDDDKTYDSDDDERDDDDYDDDDEDGDYPVTDDDEEDVEDEKNTFSYDSEDHSVESSIFALEDAIPNTYKSVNHQYADLINDLL